MYSYTVHYANYERLIKSYIILTLKEFSEEVRKAGSRSNYKNSRNSVFPGECAVHKKGQKFLG
jgi:hypothetical protein